MEGDEEKNMFDVDGEVVLYRHVPSCPTRTLLIMSSKRKAETT